MQYTWEPEEAALDGHPPLSPAVRAAMRAWVMHDWPAAVRAYGGVVEASPGDGRSLARLGDALVHEGRAKDGLAALERALAMGQRDPETLDEYAQALLGEKRYPDAIRAFQELADASIVERPFAYYNQARTLAGAGRAADAMSALAKAIEAGFRDRPAIEREGAFAILRSDPGFPKLLTEADAED
jgi:tetratricopeptide (TPR) repeat protein